MFRRLMLLMHVLLFMSHQNVLSREISTDGGVPIDLEMTGISITNGYCFINGAYIDYPYEVSRIESTVFINGNKVFGPVWSGNNISTNVVSDDPHLDQEVIDTISSVNDKVFAEYISKKAKYLKGNFSQQEALDLLADEYRRLAFVEDVQEDGMRLIITTVDQKKFSVNHFHPGAENRITKKHCMRVAEQKRTHIEKQLNKGGCFFFSSEGGYIALGKERADSVLPELVNILNSSDDVETKHAKVKSQKLLSITSDSEENIVTMFTPTQQLIARMNAIQEKEKTEQRANGRYENSSEKE